MSLINKEISEFSAKAFHNNNIVDVTKQDVLGKWSIFFFYPADFTYVCPTELEDLAAKYDEFQKAGCEVYSVSRPGTTRRKRLPRSAIPCWRTRPTRWPGISRS